MLDLSIVLSNVYIMSVWLSHCCPVVFPQAQAVTLTVAQAFRVAFEFWEVAKEGTEFRISPQNIIGLMYNCRESYATSGK